MKTSVKIALFVVFFMALAGILFGLYLFNLKDKDLQKVKPDFVISASDLQKAFEGNETTANTTYLSKVIEVTGIINDMKSGEGNTVNVSLKTDSPLSSVICTFQAMTVLQKFKTGDKITIRGQCSGFLMDILLNNCVVVTLPAP